MNGEDHQCNICRSSEVINLEHVMNQELSRLMIDTYVYFFLMFLKVLEVVLNWLKYNWEKRQKFTLQLLQKVRLGLVAPDDLKKLIGPEIYGIPGCTELLSEVHTLRDSVKSKYALAGERPELYATRSSVTVSIIPRLVLPRNFEK